MGLHTREELEDVEGNERRLTKNAGVV
jgi:hypothetical protein